MAKQRPFTCQLPADFPIDDIEAVAKQLMAADLLLPGYIPPSAGIYQPKVYLYARQEKLRTVILPDRNIASRIAQLARGMKTDGDKHLGLSAGLLVFAQCLEIEFEPGISFHELAHHAGNLSAEAETPGRHMLPYRSMR